ncbi:PREDICTED: serine/threonine-protein phosphatase 4 regulatory subunit 3-like isoform X1 [Brassica oleracea var. oleracea]|uniref:serine/threonine-protein phosphatase 4 regulatory subunit 3-like isoform X1 n=1 Tax=Brassica oleracea var. oleracea TaxID=109376 RepID=UPI0006A6F6A3|nr:PREDICTED: serine/threonine-protein phosphatase 4 regulatory subunit 3-like isoform X1 [Brassica oleracea var. oleracea]
MGAAPEKSQSNSNLLQRVKVYHLNEDGKWDDRGTGHVSIDYVERSEELSLCVVDEEDNETLLVHPINTEDIYRKQEDTIISWRDPERSTELALSFQETAGCSYVWDQICSMQRNLHFGSLNSETFHSLNSELKELPAVELTTLPLILKIVTESGMTDQMRLTEIILKDHDFFRNLMGVFKICEELENVDGLHMIFNIVKGIILLNSSQILEKIFGDELIMEIIGCLEYDPGVPHSQHHRNFLKEHVVFKEAIPIKDPLVLSKIHQTYRIGYLKDVVLARVLDDAIVANLNSVIHANNAIVVSLLKDDSTFIQELFTRLKSPSTSMESKKILVYFLHEFCSLSKSLQVVQQLRLFRDLINEGIFHVIEEVLQIPDKKLVLTGADILMLFLAQDPNLLRSYVVRTEGTPLLGLLLKGMTEDFGDKMHCQFLEIIRTLLDANALSGGVQQRANIMDIFYEKHLPELVDVITSSCPDKSANTSEGAAGRIITKPEVLLNICELLCFCVMQDLSRTRCSFLQNNVTEKVLHLTRRKEKYLVVAAIRFVRTLIYVHDDYVQSYVVKNNVLKPIMDVFIANGNRYNLLNSAVLDLLEHIRKGNATLLLKYIVDTFWDQLAPFQYLASIQAFKLKYEQCLETAGPKSTADAVDPRRRVEERALDKEEEDYFNEESDEEDSASASNTQKEKPASITEKDQAEPHLSNGVDASPSSSSSTRSGGLVDYEDDEDYKPPPLRKPEEDEDELLSVKRKPPLVEREQEPSKKPRLGKRENVFTVLCSTLSHAVRTGKKSQGTSESAAKEPEESSSSEENTRSSSDDESHKEDGVACCEHGTSSDNGKLNAEESVVVAQKSSPEMAVNGRAATL